MRTHLLVVGMVLISGSAGWSSEPTAAKADPEATRLLAEAIAARATWGKDFPGFSAAIEVNVDGSIAKGTVRILADGDVQLTGVPKVQEESVKRLLASLVGHRQAGGEGSATPCVFVSENDQHPQGRLIRLLGDKNHSSYRVRDKQIRVVNRQMGATHFSINMLENRLNAEGKFLPISYVMSTWDADGNLLRTDSHFRSWKRIGSLDLPESASVITASKEKDGRGVTTRSVTLSEHQLLEPAKKP